MCALSSSSILHFLATFSLLPNCFPVIDISSHGGNIEQIRTLMRQKRRRPVMRKKSAWSIHHLMVFYFTVCSSFLQRASHAASTAFAVLSSQVSQVSRVT